MDKTAIDQSKEEEQTAKPSVASSTVLNILKRFRSRREDTEDLGPSFDDRLGAASGPLAERISEISNLIEAGRSRDAKPSETPEADDGESAGNTPEQDDTATGDEEETTAADKTGARRKPRVRSMGFHTPVFPAKDPDTPKDPDFVASTEPPALKLHDAPDGVMENSGAPEKTVTAPKEKPMEPLDLKIFAEQVRAKLPKPEPNALAGDESSSENAETEIDAEAFKKHFYSRISKASNASVFEPFSAAEEPKVLRMPVGKMNLEARGVTASTALHSWRKFQSPGEQTTDGEETDHLETPLRAVETETAESVAKPADVEEPEGEELPTPETEAHTAEQEPYQFDHASFEPQPESEEIEAEHDIAADISEDFQEIMPEPAATTEQEPEAEQMEDSEPEMLSDPDPAASDTESGPEHPQDEEPAEEFQIAPDNVFAALDIDEEDLLTRVYDVIQAELHAAWGENITLNIRKIVREEVRAAVEKARSGT